MISTPLIAGVGKDAGTPADLSLAGFLGGDAVDFKNVVAGFFAAEAPTEKSPREILATGEVEAGHKGSGLGVKESNKPKAKPELQPEALVNVLAPVPAPQPESKGAEAVGPDSVAVKPEAAAVEAASGALAHYAENPVGTAEVTPFSVVKHGFVQQKASPPDSDNETEQTNPNPTDRGVSSFHRTAGEWEPQTTRSAVKSFHRASPQAWQVDETTQEGSEVRDAKPEAVAVQASVSTQETDTNPATFETVARSLENAVVAPAMEGVQKTNGQASKSEGWRAEQSQNIDVTKPTPTVTAKPISSPNVFAQQIPQSGIEQVNDNAATAANPQVIGANDLKDPRHALSQTAKPAAPDSVQDGVNVITDSTVGSAVVATVTAPDHASEKRQIHSTEVVGAAVATPKPEPASEQSVSVASTAPNAEPESEVSAPRTETRKPQANVGRVDGSGKLKTRRGDDKQSAVQEAGNQAHEQAQPKHVEAAGSVLGSTNKEHAGQPIHRDVSSVKDAPATAAWAGAAMDADGADEAAPAVHTLVNSAKLTQAMSQSEFRVGMQSREFGSVDIRTSVARHVFSAQISVEHNDVARNLASDLPALVDRLADQQVLVGNIQIHNSGLATSSGLAQDAQAQGGKPQAATVGTRSEVEAIHPAVIENVNASGRLDIRV